MEHEKLVIDAMRTFAIFNIYSATSISYKSYLHRYPKIETFEDSSRPHSRSMSHAGCGSGGKGVQEEEVLT
jgi:hypothetical protein